jgi:hypothetical protein
MHSPRCDDPIDDQDVVHAARHSVRLACAFLPFSVGIAVTSELVAKFLQKVGPRLFSSLGPFLVALGLLWLSRLDLHSTYAPDILGPTLLLAVGLGFTLVPLTLGATSGIAPADMGIASVLLNTSQQIGGTLGPAVLVTVATTVSPNWLRTAVRSHGRSAWARTLALNSALHGYRSEFLVGAAIATIGGLVAVAFDPSCETAKRDAASRGRASGERRSRALGSVGMITTELATALRLFSELDVPQEKSDGQPTLLS